MEPRPPPARQAAPPRERHLLVVRLLAAVVILGAAVAAVVLRLALADEAERFTRPTRPRLFQGAPGELGLGAHTVFGVAHNAGDTVEAAARALGRGARVVEIDVVASRGELFVSHDRPIPAFGFARLQAPRLESIWRAVAGADAVVLDLKQSSPLLLVPLVEFLEGHRGPAVVVVSRSVLALRELRDASPWARRFLSVRSRVDLERLYLDPTADGVVQGVSVRQELLDAQAARRLKERGLVVLAWVVNDAGRVNELGSYGVDGIVTDNLSIVELLAGQGPAGLLTAETTAGEP